MRAASRPPHSRTGAPRHPVRDGVSDAAEPPRRRGRGGPGRGDPGLRQARRDSGGRRHGLRLRGNFPPPRGQVGHLPRAPGASPDRKSTRLNSSHVEISYDVFCLKKKKKENSSAIKKKKKTTTRKR